MLRLFLQSSRRFFVVVWATFSPTALRRSPAPLRRALIMLAFVPAFAALQAMHWLGFLLDEVLFRGYRKIPIRQPIFIVGVPRSGTTLLHRQLAQDPQFTTFQTWECILAPSVTERRLWLAAARLDRRLGGPARHLVHRLLARLSGPLDGVHPMGLNSPEEDYLALTPILAAFILVLPFPQSTFTWRMGTFDRDMPVRDRRSVMSFYEACLKKHLYVHGPQRRLLSKNASFAPLVRSLCEQFPDCRLICCLRDPLETVPSQLSALRSGLRLFGQDPKDPLLGRRLVQQLAYYYEQLLTALPDYAPDRYAYVTLHRLHHDLFDTVSDAYAQLGIAVSRPLSRSLEQHGTMARRYTSAHTYALEDFGLNADAIRRDFRTAYEAFDFTEDRLLGNARQRAGANRGSTPDHAGFVTRVAIRAR